MSKKTVSVAILALLLTGLLTLASNIQSVRTSPGTMIVPDDYITVQEAINNANEGDTVFVKNGTYYERVSVNKTLILEGESKDSTVIDGNWTGEVVILTARNVKISNLKISNGFWAIDTYAENSEISNCVITSSSGGIRLNSNKNRIVGNLIDHTSDAISMHYSNNNTIIENTISNCEGGTKSSTTIRAYCSNYSSIYHNSFINDRWWWHMYDSSYNWWDNGREGNYWSNYNVSDSNGDGIGDAPLLIPYAQWIDDYNIDHYPLVKTWTSTNIAIINVKPSKTIVGWGYSLNINVKVANQGSYTETFNITIYANNAAIATLTNISLASRNTTTVTFTLDTTGFEKYKDYEIKACSLPVPYETLTEDNTFTDSTVTVTIVGDITLENKVDMKDIGTAAKAFGSYPEHERWNSNADINDDSRVDMKDIGIIAKEFGKTA